MQVLRGLADCYDQIVHPQKRRDIKNTLDAVMARVCQVKSELVRFNPKIGSDLVQLDNFLVDMKLSPQALEFPIPLHFREDQTGVRLPFIEAIDAAYEQHNLDYQDDDTAEFKKFSEMSVHQAVKLIQTHERGRQGINRAFIMKDLKEDEYSRSKTDIIIRRTDPVQAAITIQKVFRGFLARKLVKEDAINELVFLGFLPDKKEEVNAEVREAAIRQVRKTKQVDNELQYVQALDELKVSLKETEGPEIRSELRDERFKWWLKEKEEKGIMHEDFTEFYNKNVVKKEPDDVEVEEITESKGKGKKDAKGDGKKEVKTETKKEAKKDDKKKAEAEDADQVKDDKLTSTFLIGPSEIVGDMKICVERYKNVWSTIDESDNFQQRYNLSMAKDIVRPFVKEQIRQEIDISLLELLANLKQQALQQLEEEAKGKGKKGGGKATKSSKKGGGGKKSKAEKKGAGGKKTKEKCCDGLKLMKEDDTWQTMVLELVESRVLQKLPRKFNELKHFLGDFNLIGSSIQLANMNLDPSMAQLRACLIENTILPLGSSYVKSNAPLINSLLLFGASGTGKTHLSKAIGCHAGAMWFDLSPRILESMDLTDKSAASRLVHLVFTLAEQMQPSVIYIDEIEKLFMGKGKKGAGESNKILKDLISHKDLLTNEHRILVIGNSSEPYDDGVDVDQLCSFFSLKEHGKALFCPHPDYNTRLKLWSSFITKKGLDITTLSMNKAFDLGSLAHVSSGYTAGSIAQAVNTSLSARRVQQILEGKRALECSEFLTALSKTKCVYDDEYKKLIEFSELVTGEKTRKSGSSEGGEEKKKGKKGEKKKKKK